MAGLQRRSLPLPTGAAFHLVGIGGAGMSAVATVLWEAGYAVTGSDLRSSPAIDALRAACIPVAIGHAAANVGGCSLLVRSSAVPDDNPEIQRAQHLGIPILNHAEFLGLLSQAQRTLAVAGTSGKTTTTAMLSTIAIAAGLDPTILVGGVLPTLGSGARLGSSDFLVVEADEFERRFLQLHPEIAVVTNVQPDHLDYYANFPEIVDAFRAFVGRVPDEGWIVACGDDPVAAHLADDAAENAITFGLTEAADWRAVGLSKNDLGGHDFYVLAHETLVGHFRLRVPGRHNVLDALAATVAAGRVGVEFTTAAAALEQFTGVQRRLELKGEARGVQVVDDYSHNPPKVRAALAALREHHEGRIVCLFQPHTYHRLGSLFDEFAHAFLDADVVIVSEVYAPAGRRSATGDRTSEDLSRAIVGTIARYGGDLTAATRAVAQSVRSGDIVVTMGAGDVTDAGPALLRILAGGEDQ